MKYLQAKRKYSQSLEDIENLIEWAEEQLYEVSAIPKTLMEKATSGYLSQRINRINKSKNRK